MGKADLHCHTNFSGITHLLRIPFPESVTPPEKMVDREGIIFTFPAGRLTGINSCLTGGYSLMVHLRLTGGSTSSDDAARAKETAIMLTRIKQ